MGTLFIQKRWFKSPEDYDRFKSQGKDKIRAGSYFLIGLVLKIYLQILFLVNAYTTRIMLIDNQIKWCYNTFDKLEIPYQKYY